MVLLNLVPYLLLLFISTFLGVGCKNRTWGLIFVLAIFGQDLGMVWDGIIGIIRRAIQEAGYGLDRFEWLPRQLGYIAHELSFVQLYFIVVAFFSMLFVIKALKRMSENFSVSLYIFLTFPLFFLFSLVIDRFFLALAIMFYGSTFLFKGRKIIPFIICLLIAFNIHKASLVSILFLIPYYIRVRTKDEFILVCFCIDGYKFYFSLYSRIGGCIRWNFWNHGGWLE